MAKFLKLSDRSGDPIVLNFDFVVYFHANEAGTSIFLGAELASVRVKESFEKVCSLLEVSDD